MQSSVHLIEEKKMNCVENNKRVPFLHFKLKRSLRSGNSVSKEDVTKKCKIALPGTEWNLK